MLEFKDKTLLITGGTGSFGNAVLNRFLNTDIKEIRVFSRDELKQDNMRHEYQAKYPDVFNKLKFYIGDVRDIQSIKNAMHGVDYVYHAAALKQVPSCEFFPIEAVKTNVLGTENVLTAAIEAGVKRVVCLSTDKAAYPVNAMGTSKAMMEKVIVAKSRTVDPEKTSIMCTRYGNVLASRGSVVPLFINQIKAGNDLTVTSPDMTRFVMTLEEAVYKMTNKPAKTFKIDNRGLLKEGYFADVVIFDENTTIDKGTFVDPIQFPEGISHVMVNGELVINNYKKNEVLPGRVIRIKK